MIEGEDIVTAVVAAADGELASRVRLQKTVYLLDRLGFKSGFGDYEYHHYGPYSAALDYAIVDARAFGRVKEEYKRRRSDGAPYSVFRLIEGVAPNADAYGALGSDRTREFVRRFVSENVTVLELAATVDWLWREEKVPDWRREITKRRGVKVQDGRLEKAVALLADLGLDPPASPDTN